MAAELQPETAMDQAIALFDRLVRLLAYVAGGLMIAIALLVVFNVVRRYFFGDPVFGAFDLIQVGMVPAIFLGMAYAGRSGAHVSVDALGKLLPRGFWRVADTLVRLLVAIAFGLLTWRAALSAIRSDTYGEATNLLHIPLAPFWWTVVLGAGLSTIIHLAEAVFTASGHRDPVAAEGV